MKYEIMKINEVKEGQYYWAEYDKNKRAIIKPIENGSLSGAGIVLYTDKVGNEYYHKNGWSCEDNIRLATEKEVDWLNACIEANKFIPLEEIKSKEINIILW